MFLTLWHISLMLGQSVQLEVHFPIYYSSPSIRVVDGRPDLKGCSVGAFSSVGTGGALPRDPSGEHWWGVSAPKPKAYAPEYAFLRVVDGRPPWRWILWVTLCGYGHRKANFPLGAVCVLCRTAPKEATRELDT